MPHLVSVISPSHQCHLAQKSQTYAPFDFPRRVAPSGPLLRARGGTLRSETVRVSRGSCASRTNRGLLDPPSGVRIPPRLPAPRGAVRAAPTRPGRHASLGKGTGLARIERVMHEPQTRPRASASRMFCSDVLGEVLGELLRFCEVASSTLSCATGVHFEQRGGRFARKAYKSYTNPTLYKVLAF